MMILREGKLFALIAAPNSDWNLLCIGDGIPAQQHEDLKSTDIHYFTCSESILYRMGFKCESGSIWALLSTASSTPTI
ncbi:hypothetical protein ACHAXM_007866 [Skeletonema potamos]